MAITHTQTVTSLQIINNSDNIVSEVSVKTVSVDDSDPSTLTIEGEDSFEVDTSGGTSASGFVAYESLTENVVLGWLATPLAASSMKTKNEAKITNMMNRVEIEGKDLPW